MDSQNAISKVPEKKKHSPNLPLAIVAVSLVGGGFLAYFLITFVVPIVYYIVDFILCLLGWIPLIGIPFNILSLLLSGVYSIISLFNGFVWLLALGAIIVGIVMGIMALIKSHASPDNGSTLERILSICAIAFGGVFVIAMMVLLIISIITSILSFVLSIVGLVVDIMSFVMM